MLPPVPVPGADARVVTVNCEGRLLVFPASEVPELPRGKGNKLFGIPTKKAATREETLTHVAVLAPTVPGRVLGRTADDPERQRS